MTRCVRVLYCRTNSRSDAVVEMDSVRWWRHAPSATPTQACSQGQIQGRGPEGGALTPQKWGAVAISSYFRVAFVKFEVGPPGAGLPPPPNQTCRVPVQFRRSADRQRRDVSRTHRHIFRFGWKLGLEAGVPAGPPPQKKITLLWGSARLLAPWILPDQSYEALVFCKHASAGTVPRQVRSFQAKRYTRKGPRSKTAGNILRERNRSRARRANTSRPRLIGCAAAFRTQNGVQHVTPSSPVTKTTVCVSFSHDAVDACSS